MSNRAKRDTSFVDSPKDVFGALVNLARVSDADLVQVVARDKTGKLLSVGAVATGEDAVALNRFLKRRALTDRGPHLRRKGGA